MAITPGLMTWQELAQLPDDGMRYELVRGVLRTMPPPKFPHGRLARKIGRSLDHHVESAGLGEVYMNEFGYLLTTRPDTVRAPDVAFLSTRRLAEARDITDYFPGSPDLVVEVVSPSDRLTEVARKVAEWLEHGARLVFVVNPRQRNVAVYRPGQPIRVLGIEDTLSGEDVVPGWSMAVGDLFD
ncbi:MAG TPA: Uma2 family endonuclease [Chloroflexota bacterium]|nr:Uma2 family endonuclease [Chloroflexota bacterium]